MYIYYIKNDYLIDKYDFNLMKKKLIKYII